MKNKIIKIALIGKTNAGKSTLINSLVGEKISIINKKINTTQECILGIKNIFNTQIIFYDTPGSNLLKTNDITQKKLKTNIWQAIDNVDLLVYLIDVTKFNHDNIKIDIEKISESKKPIVIIFNKIDLIENNQTLPYINLLKENINIIDFFLISAKYKNGIIDFLKYLDNKSYLGSWIYTNNEITDKDDIYISNECTRNAILEYLHKEIPYNIEISNVLFKFINKQNLKIKQNIKLDSLRYKPIILGKKGLTIKKIREKSQDDIKNILNTKVHLYLKVITNNEK